MHTVIKADLSSIFLNVALSQRRCVWLCWKVNISFCLQRAAGAGRGGTWGQADPGRGAWWRKHAQSLPANQQRDLWGVREIETSSRSCSFCTFQRAQERSLLALCPFQNEDRENERKRQRELQEARTNSPKTDQEEEEDDNDEELDDTRQTPENGSSGER